jgi:hypothetical protein
MAADWLLADPYAALQSMVRRLPETGTIPIRVGPTAARLGQPCFGDGRKAKAGLVYANVIDSLNGRYRLDGRHPIRSAARSPIMTAVACVLPRTMSGMIDASAMWRPRTP